MRKVQSGPSERGHRRTPSAPADPVQFGFKPRPAVARSKAIIRRPPPGLFAQWVAMWVRAATAELVLATQGFASGVRIPPSPPGHSPKQFFSFNYSAKQTRRSPDWSPNRKLAGWSAFPLQRRLYVVLVNHFDGRATIAALNSDLGILNTRIDERTFWAPQVMSALPPIADMCSATRHVRVVP